MHLFIFPLILLIPTKKQLKGWKRQREVKMKERYEARAKRRAEREAELEKKDN